MGEALIVPVESVGRSAAKAGAGFFAALDLGTNNCRLLIATPTARGFRIVDSYSRIVRLGEGMSASGCLGDVAMERAISALSVCAEKITRHNPKKVRAVATQACRSASNGAEFVKRAFSRTGIRLDIIPAAEEARLAVAGCLDLLDFSMKAALVLDVGGGSTELSWIDLTRPGLQAGNRRSAHRRSPIGAWTSVPIGVVSLAEQFTQTAAYAPPGYRAMVDYVKTSIARFDGAEAFRPAFASGSAHMVGTSGAITSLAGLHLDLPRYVRSRVDGLWMTRTECEDVADRLAGLTVPQRAALACIGPDRADLVLAGAAILQAVQELWPCERVRVADRGLREGLLLSLMSEQERERPRRRFAGGIA